MGKVLTLSNTHTPDFKRLIESVNPLSRQIAILVEQWCVDHKTTYEERELALLAICEIVSSDVKVEASLVDLQPATTREDAP